ncbi:N-acetylglucosamine-6-phosphate deacetylase [Albibacterium indicum]|uniref:N-acetylglucosamine-6-phosphate deacetylase n=1 Tax=Albibacterium indicum TaxID=2292082 RepID=UPI000E4FC179|nr:N-acetylglucosamine-6-phosphate deacetylase [Pedobacter indicus]
MSKIKLTNGRVITTQRIISDATVLIVDNKISEIGAGDIECPDAQVIDVEGKYISPGFLDIHIHGGGNHDFMDGSVDAFLAIAETHAKYGTTAMVPTTLTSEKENLLNTLSLYEEANRINSKGSQFLGMHLEGPYFAMNQRGAQDPRYIRNPDPKEYEEVISKSSCISRWSAAPELPGSLEFGRYLRENGILAAIAHTDAVYEEVVDAVECGYSLATHLYSGMSGVTRRNAHRYAGVIESAFIIDSMDVEVIADGIHLPAPFLRLIYKIKGPDRIALITDAMRGAGMPPGESILGNKDSGLKVIIEEGVAKLPDRTAFAGSVATADRLVRNMIELADVPLVEAVKMMSITPARIVGVDSNKGSLMVGKDADIVVFDEKINIFMTMVNGNIVYKNL